MGQKVCYVVFPQEDPSETEPLTASKAIDWAVQSALSTSTPVLPVFALQFLTLFGQFVDGEEMVCPCSRTRAALNGAAVKHQ